MPPASSSPDPTPSPSSQKNARPTPLRCQTGVPGLDDILGGGLPAHRLYLLKGDPGVGKTTLALQFLLEGIRNGEAVLYITLSETREEMDLVAHSHGWTLDGMHLFELADKESQLQGSAENTFFHPAEVELNRTTNTLLEEVMRINPSRVVFDSLSEMRMLADTPLRYRRQILQLKQFLSGRKCTVLFLDDCTSGSDDLQVESIAHGVISITLTSPDYGSARRRLIVQKIRGQKFLDGFHDIVLREGGLVAFPRLVAAAHRSHVHGTSFASGIAQLDLLLGGGLDRGTSTMFMGPPGTGKSTLAIKFAHAAASRGERALMLIFDETSDTLLNRARKLGTPLEEHVASGLIDLRHIDPAEISPGELADSIRARVLHHEVRLVVIDSINGYLNAMPAERHLNLQLHELLAFLNHQSVITIMILAQQGVVGVMSSDVDLTYLADSVVLLRYYESRGAVRQAISVIKKRSGNHERTIREIAVDAQGIRLGPPLENLQGVLSGTPTLVPDTRPSSQPLPAR
jgi:circadian clock protein KaiC